MPDSARPAEVAEMSALVAGLRVANTGQRQVVAGPLVGRVDRVHGRCPTPRRGAAGGGVPARVRELLREVGVLHADETPGVRVAGGLEYVHVACTEFLTAMHTGGRSKADIDAGRCCLGSPGRSCVRDGYAGYVHLVDADHAWCAAHLLRDLRSFYRADPEGQFWAAAMADTLAAQPSRTRQAPPRATPSPRPS